MSKLFTRLGKEITIAAKEGGPNPEHNSRLRVVISTARTANMPKDNIERAIKRAVERDHSDFKEMVYEGYGPHGIAILVETVTDNPNRTVANVRSYFSKAGGSLGTSGSVEFLFNHNSTFKIKPAEIEEGAEPITIDLEELELELIDHGVEEVFEEDGEVVIYGSFDAYGPIQKYIEENSYQLISGGFERIPINPLTKLPPEERAEVEKLLERLEDDDDVQAIHHTMSQE